MQQRRHNLPSPFIIPGIVLLLVIIIGLCIVSAFSGDDSITKDNIAKLEKLENKDVAKIEAEMKKQAAEASTISEEELKKIPDYTNAELAQHYEGCVILGDSITDAIAGYELLGRDIVVSKIGLSVAKADEQIATAIGLSPSTIIMCFGANDLETYQKDSSRFVEEYEKQIKKIQKALPDTRIVVNSIFPMADSTIQEHPNLGYYSEYNAKLKEMCSRLNCTYIDSTSLVKENPNYFEPDGEHLIFKFYPKWLTYMAIKAGL